MSPRLARLTSFSILLLAIASILVAVVFQLSVRGDVPEGLVVVHGDLDTPGMREVVRELQQRAAAGDALRETVGGPYNAGFSVVVVALIAWIGVGTFIVWRQPRHWAGWLFIIIGAPLPILTLFQALAVVGMKLEPVPFLPVLAVLAEFALYPLALVPLLFLLYPDGHLPSPRWRWSVIGLVGGTMIAFLAFLLRPGPFNAFREDGIAYENPLGIDAFADVGGPLIAVGTIVALVAAVSTAIAVVQRFRRSTGDERSQMRVLALVAGVAAVCVATMVVFLLAGSLIGLEDESAGTAGDDVPPVFPILFGLAAFTIVFGTPGAYVVAILRHRLWNIDVVVRKAVIFAVVAGAITLGGVLFALVIPALVFGIPLVGTDLVLVVAGLALGLLIGPIRRRARRVADRIVFGGRATPYEVLTAFSERVAETYATDDVLPRMARVLGEATGAASARVALRVQSDLRQAATWPEDAETHDDGHVVDVVHQGEDVGTLAVTMPPNDPMDASKERLVRDLAAQAGPVLRNVRLIEELRASRQRLVVAQDEERRKLERNLHDGAQQQLVALQVQLRLAEQVMERDADKAREIVHRLQGAAASALDDLRELARGIYPPLLADQGLGAALEAQARKASLPVTVETDGTGRYPREVESAIYFCSLEALNNIAKYAHATAAEIRLAERDDDLEFRVVDDGAGFDPDEVGDGTGLRGMADRLEAIGGTITVTSAPGGGTTVLGRIPLHRD